MRNFPSRSTLAVVWAALSAVAAFGAPPDQTADRERIARERAVAESLFKAQESECLERFVVTPCTDKAQRQRRQALSELKQQEILLDDEARKRRAADRAQALEEKTGKKEADEARAQEEIQAPVPDRARREPHRSVEPATPRQAEAQSRQRAADQSAKSAEAAQRAEAQRKKVESAARRKAEVEKRNAAQAKSSKPASPGLPAPAASSNAP